MKDQRTLVAGTYHWRGSKEFIQIQYQNSVLGETKNGKFFRGIQTNRGNKINAFSHFSFRLCTEDFK